MMMMSFPNIEVETCETTSHTQNFSNEATTGKQGLVEASIKQAMSGLPAGKDANINLKLVVVSVANFWERISGNSTGKFGRIQNLLSGAVLQAPLSQISSKNSGVNPWVASLFL
jgi:hypothetical protein